MDTSTGWAFYVSLRHIAAGYWYDLYRVNVTAASIATTLVSGERVAILNDLINGGQPLQFAFDIGNGHCNPTLDPVTQTVFVYLGSQRGDLIAVSYSGELKAIQAAFDTNRLFVTPPKVRHRRVS